MHRTATYFFALAASAFALSAAAQGVTIEAADVPIPTEPARYLVMAPNPSPSQTAIQRGGEWDFSALTSAEAVVTTYAPVTDPTLIALGADLSLPMLKPLNDRFRYRVEQIFDFNDDAVDDIAAVVPKQGFPLITVTGGASDSLLIPAQTFIAEDVRRIREFPMAFERSWQTDSRRVTDFNLHLPAFGFDHTPGQHVYHWVRNDSVVGYGQMRVHTSAGPSIPYEVLMVRTTEYTQDSFFLGGAVAPPAIAAALGVEQGQETYPLYAYQFLRKGSFSQLVSFYYNDPAFSDFDYAIYNTATTATSGLFDVADLKYASVVYPNPSRGATVSVQLLGNDLPHPRSYTVTDISGRVVEAGALGGQTGALVELRFARPLASGAYVLTLRDAAGRAAVSERIAVLGE